MRRHHTVLALAALAVGALGLVTPTDEGDTVVVELCSEPAAERTDTTVTSRAGDGVEIAITIHRPCGATAQSPVPVILHGHGWSGSRQTTGFEAELEAGFGVVSIDQRGHGDSGGQANVMDPALEAQDVMAVIDAVAALPWVLHDVDEADQPIADDPVLFAMGGSYGGAYQTMTALTEIAEEGRTRFNALAPEITWFDLPQSLAPNDVPRSAWNALLYAVGKAGADVAPFIDEAFAWGSVTGQWPNGEVLGQDEPTGAVVNLDQIFHDHSPVAFVEAGIHIDVPVIWRQGITDTLFNLNEGLHNFEQALTADARERSIFVGYNGGHTLPTAYPSVRPDMALSGSDACSPGSFAALRLAFFEAVLEGAEDPGAALRDQHPELARYNLMTDDGDGCVRLDALPEPETHATGADVELFEDAWMSTTGAGAATYTEIAGIQGPATIAGLPVLEGTVAAAGVDQRVLFGLARGTSEADAQLIQANLLPLRVALPSPSIQQDFELELPGVAVELAEGEKLYLVVTPVSEQFFGHGSVRTPGWMGFTDLRVHLPVAG